VLLYTRRYKTKVVIQTVSQGSSPVAAAWPTGSSFGACRVERLQIFGDLQQLPSKRGGEVSWVGARVFDCGGDSELQRAEQVLVCSPGGGVVVA
jgi:hypothetical protein